jgi:hypothetical protein
MKSFATGGVPSVAQCHVAASQTGGDSQRAPAIGERAFPWMGFAFGSIDLFKAEETPVDFKTSKSANLADP